MCWHVLPLLSIQSDFLQFSARFFTRIPSFVLYMGLHLSGCPSVFPQVIVIIHVYYETSYSFLHPPLHVHRLVYFYPLRCTHPSCSFVVAEKFLTPFAGATFRKPLFFFRQLWLSFAVQLHTTPHSMQVFFFVIFYLVSVENTVKSIPARNFCALQSKQCCRYGVDESTWKRERYTRGRIYWKTIILCFFFYFNIYYEKRVRTRITYDRNSNRYAGRVTVRARKCIKERRIYLYSL